MTELYLYGSVLHAHKINPATHTDTCKRGNELSMPHYRAVQTAMQSDPYP
jgi:hypothetical protein